MNRQVKEAKAVITKVMN